MNHFNHYSSIAGLFDFPDPFYPEKVAQIVREMKTVNTSVSSDIDYFLSKFPTQSVDEMQELYTRTFDVQAITTLDLGYVLFGDDYKRGELLVNLNRELRDAEIDPKGELADHLPNVLNLLVKLEDNELRVDIVNELLVPAIDSMIAEFDPKRVERRNGIYKKHYKTVIETAPENATIYVYPLRAVRKLLEADFKIIDKQEQHRENDFLKSVNQELSIKE